LNTETARSRSCAPSSTSIRDRHAEVITRRSSGTSTLIGGPLRSHREIVSGVIAQLAVVPVGFELLDGHLYIGGVEPVATRRHRNVEAGQTRVAVVVDDLVFTDPWVPRFVRVYGEAELVERVGPFGAGPQLRIRPMTSWSFNLDGHPIGPDEARKVPHRTVHVL
jgi:pyridoxamine 5'-phosphate oxidase family protein